MKNSLVLLLTHILILIFLKNSIIFIIISSFYQIQIQFQINYTLLGIIATLFYFFSFIGSIFWTFLVGRKKRENILLLGAILFGVGIFLIYYYPFSYKCILISVAAIGVGGESTTILCFNYYIENISFKNRGKSLSLYYILQGLGAVFGSFIVGVGEGIYQINWSVLLFCVGLLLFFIQILLFFNIRLHNLKLDLKDTEIPDWNLLRPTSLKINKEIFWKIMKKKANMLIFILILFIVPMSQIHNIWLQKYWIDEHFLTQTLASISFIFTSGGEFLGLLASGFLIDRFVKKPLFQKVRIGIISCLLSVPFFFIAYSMSWVLKENPPTGYNFIQNCWFLFTTAIKDPNVSIFYILIFSGFFVVQLIGPLIPALIIESNDEKERFLAVNLSIILINLGWVIGPVLGGFLGDLINLGFLLRLVPIIYFIAGCIFVILFKNLQKVNISKKLIP